MSEEARSDGDRDRYLNWPRDEPPIVKEGVMTKDTSQLRDAAQKLLAEGSRLNVEQVHEVILREVDANEDNPDLLMLAPLGDVLLVRITKADGNMSEVYVSMKALGSSLPALGFRWELR